MGETCLSHPDFSSFCTQSLTTQEFIFNEYLHICPDIIYHMSTVAHDIARFKLNQFQRNVHWFYALLNEYHIRCPNTVYYWGTSGHVAESLVPEKFKTLTTNKVLYEYNQIINNSLPTYAKHGFDQWIYTATMNPTGYMDAVHLNYSIYDTIAIAITSLLDLNHTYNSTASHTKTSNKKHISPKYTYPWWFPWGWW